MSWLSAALSSVHPFFKAHSVGSTRAQLKLNVNVPTQAVPLLTDAWLVLEPDSDIYRSAPTTAGWVQHSAVSALPPLKLPRLTNAEILDFGYFFPAVAVNPIISLVPWAEEVAEATPSAFTNSTLPLDSNVPEGPAQLMDDAVSVIVSRPALPQDKDMPVLANDAKEPLYNFPLTNSSNSVIWGRFGEPQGSLPALVTPLDYRRVNNYQLTNQRDEYSLAQYRFRPGLSTQWREHRWVHANRFNLKLRRQRRLTNYVLLTQTLGGFNYIKTLAMSAIGLARQSGLMSWASTPPMRQQAHYTAGFWLLNGRPLAQPLIQTYPGDWMAYVGPDFGALRNLYKPWYGYPRLLKRLGLSLVWTPAHMPAAPWYVEVDELTNTLAVLADPTKLSDFSPAFWQGLPFMTNRLYNWKYIT